MQDSFVRRLLTRQHLEVGSAVGAFFSLKFVLGLGLIGISSSHLSIADFVVFSQLFLFFALLSTIAAAGVQNGLTRQIAFASGDRAAEHRAVAAAVRIWAIASLIIILLATIFRTNISHLLVGDASLAGVVPYITLAGAGGGFGTLACSILAGRQRAPTSLMLQSAGLMASGLLCTWWLMAGDPVGAVLGYAAGPLFTSGLAAIVVRRAGFRFGRGEGQWQEVKSLLSYSLAFLFIAVVMPVTLFALRPVYLESFGTDKLAYWLAANRVSDVTSQILGLYMAQVFLPQISRNLDAQKSRHVMVTIVFAGRAVFCNNLFLGKISPGYPVYQRLFTRRWVTRHRVTSNALYACPPSLENGRRYRIRNSSFTRHLCGRVCNVRICGGTILGLRRRLCVDGVADATYPVSTELIKI
jgi:hypothetical protein